MSALSSLTGASSGLGSVNTAPSSPITVNGLISGLNTSAIIQGLLAVDQQKITALEAQKTTISSQQAAFDGIEAKVLSLQGTLTSLTSTQNSVFTAHTATSSDSDILSAAASTSAVPGVYSLKVSGLATAGQIASQGFDRLDSAITQGTLQLKIGTNTTTITVDTTNDTLQGLADAINASGAAATAYIVNDGSGDDSQGYRLVLASKNTGVANQVSVTNNLGASGAGAVQPNFGTATISNAVPTSGFSGTSTVTANVGGGYTGSTNDVYTFTVVQGGMVGNDNVRLAYSNADGTSTGTINLDSSYVGNFLNVAQGVQVQLGAGTLVNGDSFTVKTFVPTIQAATDAKITLGSGAGALTITSASNKVSNLIPGVTLSLQKSDPSTPVTVTVGSDADAMKKSITDFVNAFNDIVATIQTQTSYDASTGKAGPLLGDFRTQQLEEQLRAIAINAVSGANPKLNNLGALGITPDNTGKLVIDDAKLSDVLAGNVAGISANDVRKLFALTGSSTNPGVQFITGSSRTHTSATPYTLQLTQAAEQASVTASTALAASTVIDNTNNTFTVSVDGKTSQPITLPSGTYTRTALAQAVASAINSAAELNGATVQATVSANALQLTSSRYGSDSNLGIVSGTALAALGFAGGENADGRDVVGSFLVNGNTEPALGQGQFLTGNAANANTAGLELRVTLTPADIGTGLQTPVSVSNGLAAQLSAALNTLTDPVTGRFQQVDADYKTKLQSITDQETQQNAYIQQRSQLLLTEFTNMERTLSKLQAMSSAINALAQNLTSISNTTSNSNSRSNSSSG